MEKFYSTRYQSGSFPLINVESDFFDRLRICFLYVPVGSTGFSPSRFDKASNLVCSTCCTLTFNLLYTDIQFVVHRRFCGWNCGLHARWSCCFVHNCKLKVCTCGIQPRIIRVLLRACVRLAVGMLFWGRSRSWALYILSSTHSFTNVPQLAQKASKEDGVSVTSLVFHWGELASRNPLLHGPEILNTGTCAGVFGVVSSVMARGQKPSKELRQDADLSRQQLPATPPPPWCWKGGLRVNKRN